MCLSAPKPPASPVIPPPPPAPPPAEQSPVAPIIDDEGKRRASKERDSLKTQRRGTRALRIDLNIPGSGSGLNVPRE